MTSEVLNVFNFKEKASSLDIRLAIYTPYIALFYDFMTFNYNKKSMRNSHLKMLRFGLI